MAVGVDMAVITDAARRLRGGEAVAFPTETVYGLGAIATDRHAVKRVFALKGRPANNPLIVHVDGGAMAHTVVNVWTDAAGVLAERFWPGPLTLVLPRHASVPDVVTGGGHTVAVRCPDHAVALTLIGEVGAPIVGPSANRSGGVSPTTAAHVRSAFGEDEVPVVLDGGACRTGIESTVVSLVSSRPSILRPGAVTREELEDALGEEVEFASAEAERADAPLAGPGMMASHYAPGARAVLFDARDWPGCLSRLRAAGDGAGLVAVLTHTLRAQPADDVVLIEMPPSAGAYAARLYAALREADDLRPGVIAIERPEEDGGLWDAVRDRLGRATAGK